MPIFVFFVSTGVLFGGAFSLWISLNGISFTFLSYRTKFVSYTRRLLQKRNELKNYVKNYLKINSVEFRIHVLKNHLCFYKNSTIQTLTFISSKIVYFKKYLAYQTLHPSKGKFSLLLNVPYPSQTIKLEVGAMAEPLHTWLKGVLRNLLFECVWKDNYINGPKRSLTKFTVNKRNQLVRLILDKLYSFFKSELAQLDIWGHTK